MQKSIIISKVLYYISRILGGLYLITGVYGLFSWATNTHLLIKDKQTIITYPFTKTSFLILDSNTTYLIFSFLIPVLGYGLFFWLLSSVFKVFYQKKLFTAKNIVHLRRFYLVNIFLPTLLTIFSSFFMLIEHEMFLIIILHLVLGVFVFFMSEIFNQGLHLQNEQDLYI
ncbi:DUF2975 domain-containing protein [Tenacibaculum sp. IB213877]|uniref:DUF2975 domain-containing protein n=1 Tax=Tenacibaculum sp. IB213877 TaxID=3097351 RepID=UPI002A5A1DF6|nr:DUF2975 domain-containing protein [Tenacibaculum sp. IB213877]MDY0781669.1 DUF2975 domain-containing protein [Tenacibaculum sp. IB213877]